MTVIRSQQSNLSGVIGKTSQMAAACSDASSRASGAASGLGDLDFSGRDALASEIMAYSNRLNLQQQRMNDYGAAIRNIINELDAADSADTVAGLGNKILMISESPGSAFSLAGSEALSRNIAVSGMMMAGGGIFGLFNKLLKAIKNWFKKRKKQNSGENNSSGNSSGNTSENVNIDHTLPSYCAYGPARSGDWPDSYNKYGTQLGSGCAISSLATVFSGLTGRKITPREVMGDNAKLAGYKGDIDTMTLDQYNKYNPEFINNWADMGSKYGLTCDRKGDGDSVWKNQDSALATLDKALDNYIKDPDKYSAPIIHANNHFVVVKGRNSDGTYNIIDSSGVGKGYSGAPIYKYSNRSSEYKRDGEGFVGKLDGIVQYHY